MSGTIHLKNKEIWKDVKGFPNYQISNYGKVKNLKTNAIKKQRINKNGYCDIKLNNNGKYKMFLVHRLVAEAFIPNLCKYKEVNHIDGNKKNNRVDNLEWCNRSQNVKHAYRENLYLSQKQHLKKIHKDKRKKVIQQNIDKSIVRIWNSATEIENELGYSRSVINNCCLQRPHYLTAYGYKWKYIKEEEN